MIEVDFKKELPFYSELHTGMEDNEIEDYIKQFKIDPEKDEDLRFWFLLQKVFQTFSAEGKFPQQVKYMSQKNTVEEMYKHFKVMDRKIEKEYRIPRKDWDLISIAGNYYKLWKNMQEIGMKCLSDFSPESKTAVTRSCTARKPYNIPNMQKEIMQKYDMDLIVWSYCMVPYKYVNEYPFAYYIGVMGDKEGYAKSGELTIKTFEDFFNKYKYDEIIDYCRPNSNRKKISVPYLREHGWDKVLMDYRPNHITHPLQMINYYGVEDHFLHEVLKKKQTKFTLNKKII